MSYSSGAEIGRLRIKDGKTLGAIHREVQALKGNLRTQEIAIAAMGKEIKALRQLITFLKIEYGESITGDTKK